MPKSGPKTPQLIVKSDGTVHPIPEGITRIGRAAGNNIVLPDTSISRFQCYLVRQVDTVKVFDADDSRNKTRLGKKQAHGQTLQHGHILKLGRLKLIFRDPESVEAPTALPVSKSPKPAKKEAPAVSSSEQDSDSTPAEPAAAAAEQEEQVHPQPVAVAATSSSRRKNKKSSKRWTATPQLLTLAPVVILTLACTIAGGVFLGMRAMQPDNSEAAMGTTGAARAIPGTPEAELAQLRETVGKLNTLAAQLQDDLEQLRSRISTVPLRIENEITESEMRTSSLQFRRLERIRRDLDRIKEFLQLPDENTETAQPVASSIDTSMDTSTDPLAGSELAKAIAQLEEETEESDEPTTVRRVDPPKAKLPPTEQRQPSTKERVKLPARQINDLVNHLADMVDNFASPEATPKSLQPELEMLSHGVGDPAARGVLKLEAHARDRVERVDHNIGYLEKKIARLLRQAKKATGGKKEGSSSRGYGKASSPYELKQRDLELSKKKLEILKDQRVRLSALYNTVLNAMIDVGDPKATKYLADRFATDDHLPLRVAILDTLAAHRATHTVPVLAGKIRHRNQVLRARIHQTLRTIVGEDLGDKPSAWLAWHKENRANE